MAGKSLVMTFINEMESRASINLPEVRDNISEAKVETVMDLVIGKNIFSTTGGDLVARYAAQIVERNVTELDVR